MILPVPEWTPDQTTDGSGNPDDDIIKNVVAESDFYTPWPTLETITGSLSSRAKGAIGAIDTAGIGYDYAGDLHDLYRLVSLSWVKATNLTLSATFSYSTSTDAWWEFTQWGNTVIATNGTDPMQEITLGSANFVDLAGGPPVAKHLAVVKDFVMAGNLPGFPQRVRWCAINNTHAWTVDATTQADFQDLVGDGGHVQKVVGGNVATIFQERAIWMAQYVGSPGIFSFGNGPVARTIGLLAPQSVATYGATIFFLAEGGFYRIDGGTLTPIGRDKIDKTFFQDLDTNYVHYIQATVDPVKKLYIVAYPGAGNTGGILNNILLYNFEVNRWTVVTGKSLEMVWRYITTAYTLEGLDSVGDLDSLPASLDSALWAGGKIYLSAFNSNHVLQTFTGDPEDGTVTTREFAPLPGRRAKITRVRPLVDANAASITPMTRNRLADARQFGTNVAQNANGDCPIRTNAQYISFKILTSGDFKRIRGAEVLDFSDAGNR